MAFREDLLRPYFNQPGKLPGCLRKPGARVLKISLLPVTQRRQFSKPLHFRQKFIDEPEKVGEFRVVGGIYFFFHGPRRNKQGSEAAS